MNLTVEEQTLLKSLESFVQGNRTDGFKESIKPKSI